MDECARRQLSYPASLHRVLTLFPAMPLLIVSMVMWEREHQAICIPMEMDVGDTREMEPKSEYFILFLGS